MDVTGLSVFKFITDTMWTVLYERPDLYVYVTDEMVSWLGLQKKHMIDALNARCIAYKSLYFAQLREIMDQVMSIPVEAYVKPSNYKHILLRPMDFQLLAATVQTQKGKQIAAELVKLGFVVTCFRQYEVEVKEQELLHEQQKNKVLENDIKDLVKCKAMMTKDPLKDLTLKVIMFQDDKFAVIRGQRSHAAVYQKRYMNQLSGHEKTVDFTKHPNAMSKWAKMRQLLSENKKIQKN